MRRTIFITIIMCLSALAAFAQDKIHFLDSRVVDAVVDEVGNELIYYRAFQYQNGPVYSVPVSHVEKIVYHNGYEQVIGGGMVFDESLLTAVGGTGGKMRFDRGKLYIGSHTAGGHMQADYVAFNLYGDDYYKARSRRTATLLPGQELRSLHSDSCCLEALMFRKQEQSLWVWEQQVWLPVFLFSAKETGY